MRIISTNATNEQLKEDYSELLKQHRRALKEELTWDMFGGTITVNGRFYQVVEEKRK
jgi:hypothetical protein